MFCSNSSPLELRFWQQSGIVHPKQTKGAWPSRYFTPAYQHFCYQFLEVYNDGGGKICFWEKKVPKDEGYGSEWGMTWRMKGYKYTTLTHGSSKCGILRLKLQLPIQWTKISQSVWCQIQQLEAVVITASTLRSWSSRPRYTWLMNWSDDCIQNWQDQPRCMHDIMAETLRTPNDAHSINHTVIAQKKQVKIWRTIATSL